MPYRSPVWKELHLKECFVQLQEEGDKIVACLPSITTQPHMVVANNKEDALAGLGVCAHPHALQAEVARLRAENAELRNELYRLEESIDEKNCELAMIRHAGQPGSAAGS